MKKENKLIEILIVDDDYSKISDLMKVIVDDTLVNIENISSVNNTTEARDILNKHDYDLVLLDMNVPTFKGGDPERLGGLDLIEKINSNQIKNVPNHIIATTAYEDVLNECKNNLESNLLGIIHYDKGIDDWKQQIINKIEYIIKSKKNSYGKPFIKYDIGIVAALESPELDAILSLPNTEWNTLSVPGDSTTIYKETTIVNTQGRKLKVIAASAPRMGMASSSILTTKMCNHFHPEYLFMIGIAAGTKGDSRNFGDILVAQLSWDWESGKMTTTEDGEMNFSPDHTQVTLDEDIETKIRSLVNKKEIFDYIRKEFYPKKTPETDLKLHIGPVASGSKVVQNDDIMKEIKSFQRKIIGLDMETHGVMLATRYSIKSKPKAICIKSICDFGDKDKSDDWQKYAAYTSANFTHIFIRDYLY